jgi:hypothetical protein
MRGLFWRSLDQLLPEGRPVFLVLVIVALLILNAMIALSRW